MDWTQYWIMLGMNSNTFSKAALLMGLLIGTACAGNSASPEELKKLAEDRINCAAIRKEVAELRQGSGGIFLIEYFDESTTVNWLFNEIWEDREEKFPHTFKALNEAADKSTAFIRRDFQKMSLRKAGVQ